MMKIIVSFCKKWIDQKHTIDKLTEENIALIEKINKKTIEKAEFKPPNTTIHWFEALEKYYKKVIKKVNIFNANTVTKEEITKAFIAGYNSRSNEDMIGGTGNEENEYYDSTFGDNHEAGI